MVLALLRLLVLFSVIVAAQSAAPVVIDGQQLWTIRAPRAEFSPAERARDIQENILHIASDNRRSLSDIREIHNGEESILILSRAYVFSVTSADAAAENRPREQLFAERKQLVIAAITAYHERRSLSSQLRALALSGGAFLLAIAALFLLQRLYQRLANSLQSLLSAQFHKQASPPSTASSKPRSYSPWAASSGSCSSPSPCSFCSPSLPSP